MKDSGELLQLSILQVAKFLLMEEICNEPETIKNIHSKTPRLEDLKKQPQNFHFNIGHFLNPFYMVSSQKNQPSQTCEERMKNCINNSKKSQSLSLLLNSVSDLPKLRYQQSQRLFTVQSEQNQNTTLKEKPNPTKLKFQTPQKNHNGPNRARTFEPTIQALKSNAYQKETDSKKQQPKLLSDLPSNHKIIDLGQPSQEQQNDIEMNMSVKSHYDIQITREDGEYYGQSVKQQYSMRKNKRFELQERRKYQTQLEQKAKQEKSIIQNYFESAKNRVLENCNLNCCEGIFSINQQQSYDPSSIHMINLKEESQWSKKYKK